MGLNYFDLLLVDGYAFPTVPQADFTFHSDGMIFINIGDFSIEYSFDGETLHGDLDSNVLPSSSALYYENRMENKVWFRAADGYGTVRIEAWGR